MPASEPIDDRLRALLAVEQRLQARIAQARDAASRRIDAARAAATHQLTDAEHAVAAACAAEAREDEARHVAAMAACTAAHENALAALARLSDDDVDRLAHQVIERLRLELGGAP